MINRFYNYLKCLEEKNSTNSVILGLKRNLQPDFWSCGIRSTYSILRFYNKIENISELKQYVSFEGIDTPVIEEMLNKYGLELEQIFNSSIEDLRKAINEGYPIITTINNAEHWIVIYGYEINEFNKITHLFIVDSAFKRVRVKWSITKFEKMWKEFDERWLGIVREKQCEF